MPVVVVPVMPRQVGAHLIVLLGVFEDAEVEVDYTHALGTAAQARDRADVGDGDLRDAGIAFTGRTTRVGEDDGWKHEKLVAEKGEGKQIVGGSLPQVFSKARAVSMLSRKSASDEGL